MPQPTKGPRLGGSPAHQRLILANLATQLFEHQRITTTEAKARRLRPYAERLITKAKVGDLHNIRQIAKLIRDKDVIYKLVHEIGPFFADREGGYTRITKTLPRKGDNAPMAVIELVAQKTVTSEADRARRVAASQQAAPAPAAEEAPVVDETPEVEEVEEVEESASTDEAPYGEGSHAPLDDPDEAPEGFEIKGNADSMLYHLPGTPFYDRTVAEVWFATAEAAEAAGFSLPPSQQRRRVLIDPRSTEPAVPPDGGLGRFRLDIAYDGTDFSGWAPQPGRRTVAGVLTEALGLTVRAPVALTVAGRTDAGVHATGQVAHADLPARTSTRRGSCGGWPGCCPSTCGCARSRPCRPRSTPGSPRCAATTATGSPPRRTGPSRCAPATRWPGRTRWTSTPSTPRPRLLLGEHDFAAFCKRREGATTVRELQRLAWDTGPDGVVTAAVSADAFCHSMVRSLVGALLDVGRGRRGVEFPAELLRRGVRASEVSVAPAHGLTLVAVDYPPAAELAARADVTRQVRVFPSRF